MEADKMAREFIAQACNRIEKALRYTQLRPIDRGRMNDIVRQGRALLAGETMRPDGVTVREVKHGDTIHYLEFRKGSGVCDLLLKTNQIRSPLMELKHPISIQEQVTVLNAALEEQKTRLLFQGEEVAQ